MSKTKPSLWFGVYGKKYEGPEPAFFDETELPWVDTLKEIYPTLKAEFLPLMNEENSDFAPYFEDRLQFPPKNWKTLHFYIWGKKAHGHLKQVPVMQELAKRIPGLITASLNVLEPHSRILPHFGDTNAVYRIHLGISVPAGLPECGFAVKKELRPWREGEVLVFLDANTHEAFNETDARRYILLLDIVRPEFESRKKYVCVKVLSILSLYFVEANTKIFTRILSVFFRAKPEGVKNVPEWAINILLSPFMCLWYFLLPVSNFIDFKGLLNRLHR